MDLAGSGNFCQILLLFGSISEQVHFTITCLILYDNKTLSKI
jgi:hypothetical protein